jgi:[ribosomal protein S18]-alanine N-acetyltransferase
MTAPAFVVERVTSEQDLDAIVEIERASFKSAWTWDMFKWELQNAPVSQVHVVRAADGAIVAFCTIWVIADEVHINNVAVLPAHRRKGLGRTLLEAVLETAASQGARRATLEVRRSNDAAIRLYQGMGFELAGARPRYYTDPEEDALILWKTSIPGPDPGLEGPA